MKCPLCGNDRHLLLRNYDVGELEKMWLSTFGFNPYPADMGSVLARKQCLECKLVYFSPECFGEAGFYDKLSREPFYYENDKWEFDAALKFIAETPPSSLLEVGCGDGSFLRKVAGAVEFVEGVDINQRAVHLCQKKGLTASTTPLNSLQRQFEMIVLFEVLEHMSNLKETIESLLKVLSPNGTLVIAVPNPDGYLKEIRVNLLDMPPHHNSSWPRETFSYIASKYNLEQAAYEREPLRYVHYIGYLSNLISEHKDISNNTMKLRLLFKLQSLVVRLMAPLTYQTDRGCLIGQTHLVVLKRR